jgi:biopolymer transport protein ExbB
MDEVDLAKSLLLRMGTGWILWLLGGLSVVSITVILERGIYFRARRGDVRALSRQLDASLEHGAWTEALTLLGRHPSAASAVASAGLRLAERGPAACEKAMRGALALERGKLEEHLVYLGTLANNAPFVGLFGTVVGIVHAFDELALSGAQTMASHASAAIMGSLSEALVATAVGLMVALPAVAAFNYFQRRALAILGDTEVLSNIVLAYVASKPPLGSSRLAGEGAS